MKQVFSLETEREKDLQTVADTVAFCQWRKDNGYCKTADCIVCETKHELDACLEQLTDCDSLRVKQLGFQSYSRLCLAYGLKKKPGEYIKHAACDVADATWQVVKWLFIFAFVVGATICMCALPFLFWGW